MAILPEMSDIVQLDWLVTPWNRRALPNQLASAFRDGIRARRIAPGQRLPSEPELATILGVSRTTLRAAVQVLVLEGLFDRKHGVGTFVSETASHAVSVVDDISQLTSTSDLIRQHGYEPGVASLRYDVEPATLELSEVLNVPIGSSVLHLSRTRTADGRRAIHVEEYVPSSIVSRELVPTGSADWSLFALLRSVGHPVVSATCRIQSVNASADLARELGVVPNHALLLLSQTAISSRGEIVLYGNSYVDTNVFRFQTLRRARTENESADDVVSMRRGRIRNSDHNQVESRGT